MKTSPSQFEVMVDFMKRMSMSLSTVCLVFLLAFNSASDNFDPETSARERRKLNRKSYFMNRKGKYNKNCLYNERGQMAANGKDMCDCLDETCPGCHFPCPKCNSNKCGHDCRSNRKWMYERIEIEGSDHVIKNEYYKK